MMREILFRGKRMDNEEWVKGDLIREPWGYCIQVVDGDGNLFTRKKYAIDTSTVGQYTGLTDKNGERLFEGDVLTVDGEDGFFALEFQEDTARFVMSGDGFVADFDNFWSYEVEIIGNIHDNPELLREEN